MQNQRSGIEYADLNALLIERNILRQLRNNSLGFLRILSPTPKPLHRQPDSGGNKGQKKAHYNANQQEQSFSNPLLLSTLFLRVMGFFVF